MTNNHEDTGNIPYLPHTAGDREKMLEAIGVRSFEEIIAHIPADLRVKALAMRDGLSEIELTRHIGSLEAKNVPASRQACFLGGGSYRRYVPSVVPQIVSRSEFATAYTPYQPEVSQGSLQAIYEFQSAICLLTGMDVANASMYDGPTACAEAGLMACRVTGRKKLIALSSVNSEYRMVTSAYSKACGLTWQTVDRESPIRSTIDSAIGSDTAAVIVQYPNFFGCFEDMDAIASRVHEAGALFVVVSDPIALAYLTTPAELGADIVVGDGQPCGNFLSFGGPSAGFMATRKDYVRQLPGRLAGVTVDNRGQRAFTLTLQTREQHIRRERATSNICTNQALNALSMLVYFTMLGKEGLSRLAEISLLRAHYLKDLLVAIDGVELAFEEPFFNEFLLKVDHDVDQLLDSMKAKGILAGLKVASMYPELKSHILVAVTEMNPVEELDDFARALENVMANRKSGARDTKVAVP